MGGNPAAITEWPTPLTLSPAPSLLMVSYSGTESLTLAPQQESASGFRDGTAVRHLNRSAIQPQKQGDPCDVKQSSCSCQSIPSDMSSSSKRRRRCSESSSSVLINSDDVEDPKQIGKRATKACDECRLSKCKCFPSKHDPNVCEQCAELGLECRFEGPQLKRGPPKGYLSSVIKRLERMEDVLLSKLAVRTGDPRARDLLLELVGPATMSQILAGRLVLPQTREKQAKGGKKNGRGSGPHGLLWESTWWLSVPHATVTSTSSEPSSKSGRSSSNEHAAEGPCRHSHEDVSVPSRQAPWPHHDNTTKCSGSVQQSNGIQTPYSKPSGSVLPTNALDSVIDRYFQLHQPLFPVVHRALFQSDRAQGVPFVAEVEQVMGILASPLAVGTSNLAHIETLSQLLFKGCTDFHPHHRSPLWRAIALLLASQIALANGQALQLSACLAGAVALSRQIASQANDFARSSSELHAESFAHRMLWTGCIVLDSLASLSGHTPCTAVANGGAQLYGSTSIPEDVRPAVGLSNEPLSRSSLRTMEQLRLLSPLLRKAGNLALSGNVIEDSQNEPLLRQLTAVSDEIQFNAHLASAPSGDGDIAVFSASMLPTLTCHHALLQLLQRGCRNRNAPLALCSANPIADCISTLGNAPLSLFAIAPLAAAGEHFVQAATMASGGPQCDTLRRLEHVKGALRTLSARWAAAGKHLTGLERALPTQVAAPAPSYSEPAFATSNGFNTAPLAPDGAPSFEGPVYLSHNPTDFLSLGIANAPLLSWDHQSLAYFQGFTSSTATSQTTQQVPMAGACPQSFKDTVDRGLTFEPLDESPWSTDEKKGILSTHDSWTGTLCAGTDSLASCRQASSSESKVPPFHIDQDYALSPLDTGSGPSPCVSGSRSWAQFQPHLQVRDPTCTGHVGACTFPMSDLDTLSKRA